MRFITRSMLVAAIDAQAETFDSHDIEKWLYKNEQPALIREFMEHVDAPTYPATETCRLIGLALLRMTDLIEKIDEVSSPTFSGELRPCALWRKLPRP